MPGRGQNVTLRENKQTEIHIILRSVFANPLDPALRLMAKYYPIFVFKI